MYFTKRLFFLSGTTPMDPLIESLNRLIFDRVQNAPQANVGEGPGGQIEVCDGEARQAGTGRGIGSAGEVSEKTGCLGDTNLGEGLEDGDRPGQVKSQEAPRNVEPPGSQASKAASENANSKTPRPPEYFPLKLFVDKEALSAASLKALSAECTKNHWRHQTTHNSVELTFSAKPAADQAVAYLLEKHHRVRFDYSRFVSHPGTLFVKNLARTLVLAEKLEHFFNEKLLFRSVADVNIISGPRERDPEAEPEVLAILKFDNYLDVEHVVATVPLALNPFHPSLPLYVNRYVSKRERLMCPESGSLGLNCEEAILYDTLVVENLGDFLGGRVKLEELQPLLEKFSLFGTVALVYFPLALGSEASLSFQKVGFISFVHGKGLNEQILRCLYYLRDLTFDEFAAFAKTDIYDICDDINTPHKHLEPLESPRLKISIAQRKHNHHLYESADCLYVYNEPGLLRLKVCDPAAATEGHDDAFLNKFMKALNYQETNVYVNNLPVLFENNDELWATFWNQFGMDGVKLAKIIKPQFYSKKSDESLGRIGFVFYEEFKMALRAIILTNNKVVDLGRGQTMAIQASFAIQKHNNSLGSGKLALSSLSSGSLSNYNYYQASDGFGKRFSLPMNDPSFYLHEPRMPSLGASGGASPYVPPESYYYYPYYMPMQPPLPAEDGLVEENGTHSPKQKTGQINPAAPPFPNPMSYMYHPYYSVPQVPQPIGMPGNGQGPYFNNYSMRQHPKDKKGERKKS